MSAPRLESPWPARISPHADELEVDVRQYLRACGLLRSRAAAEYYDASRLGYLTAQIYPDGLADRLHLVTRWFCVWTLFDDQLEKLADSVPPEAVDQVAEMMLGWLNGEGTPGTADDLPFATGFATPWEGIRSCSSADWQRRFLTHTRQYLAGCRWEAEHRRQGKVPDLDSYIASRRRFGGIRMAMDLSEFSGGYELPAELHADPVLQEMLDVLGDITLWGNDVFSVNVDREEGNVSNLIFVLQSHHASQPKDAFAVAVTMLDERLVRLAELENSLPEWCVTRRLDHQQRGDIARFVAGVHTWISGNIAWSQENNRYRTAAPRVGESQPNFLLALLRSSPSIGGHRGNGVSLGLSRQRHHRQPADPDR